MIKTIKDLEVHSFAYKHAMEVFHLTRNFPKEERYSLTDQVVRSSRSVSANIREGYAKRKYENVFIRHLVDALGSSEETREWLEYAKDCGYLKEEVFVGFDKKYDKVTAMISRLIKNWKTY